MARERMRLAGPGGALAATLLAGLSAVASASAESARGEPRLRPGLEPAVVQKASGAFELAARRVAERPACREIFAALGTDGGAALGRTLYYPASAVRSKRCSQGADAFTAVGSPVTVLCPSFGRLALERAAVVLIHEALHQAGLPEAPAPGAMTSSEINRMVWATCF